MSIDEENRPGRLAGAELAAIANAMVGLHRRYYGRGATKARTFQVHSELVLVELRDVYLTIERTLLERGQQEAVRQTRLTFQQATYQEFVGAVEQIVGRKVLSYHNQMFVHPEVVVELFYLESEEERQERLLREAREDAGVGERPPGGLSASPAGAPRQPAAGGAPHLAGRAGALARAQLTASAHTAGRTPPAARAGERSLRSDGEVSSSTSFQQLE